jgi:hypothetical protein
MFTYKQYLSFPHVKLWMHAHLIIRFWCKNYNALAHVFMCHWRAIIKLPIYYSNIFSRPQFYLLKLYCKCEILFVECMYCNSVSGMYVLPKPMYGIDLAVVNSMNICTELLMFLWIMLLPFLWDIYKFIYFIFSSSCDLSVTEWNTPGLTISLQFISWSLPGISLYPLLLENCLSPEVCRVQG